MDSEHQDVEPQALGRGAPETTLARLAANVGAGSRLLLLRPVTLSRFRVDATQVVLLALLAIAWKCALEYAAVATQAPEFVITSYSIHYTKLYECASPTPPASTCCRGR